MPPNWWLVNIGSGNGLVPSGNRPLPQSMLTHFYVTIWYHQAARSSILYSQYITVQYNLSFQYITVQYDLYSQYITVQYNNILHTMQQGKTSARFRTDGRQPYLALTGEIWLSSASYWVKSDCKISEVHCIGYQESSHSNGHQVKVLYLDAQEKSWKKVLDIILFSHVNMIYGTAVS